MKQEHPSASFLHVSSQTRPNRFYKGGETCWVDLVDHRFSLYAETSLMEARRAFEMEGTDYAAVMSAGRVVGLCSYLMITDMLSRGHQGVGYSIYQRRPLKNFLLAGMFTIKEDEGVNAVLQDFSAREECSFADDAVLLDRKGGFLGLIHAHTLVGLQNAILRQQHTRLEKNVIQLEACARELNTLNDQLKAVNDEKNEFLGIASHDLKNPINTIQLSAEMLLESINQGNYENELAKELLLGITGDCGRMMDLLKNLLDINRIESGNVHLENVECSLSEITFPALETHMIRAEKKQQRIQFEEIQQDIFVEADIRAMHQVIDNLVSNAVKYSPPGKTITVRVRSDEIHGIVEVQDEGPGITQADRARLFQKFAKLSARPTAGENSTGLGLAIVLRMVKQMGGEVGCESTPGQGAMFFVKLPLAMRAAQDEALAAGGV